MSDPTISIPKQIQKLHQKITLAIHIIQINNCYFLTTISKNIYYRTVHYLKRINGYELSIALKEAFQPYKKAGYQIHTLKADNEFKQTLSSMEDMNINVQFSNPEDHVGEAERNNRTIKERCRIIYHKLPYDQLPKSLLIQLVYTVVAQLNYMPAQHGVSSHLSPRTIIHQENISYKTHGKFTFGQSVQAYSAIKPINTLAPRTLDCIYIKPASNWQHGHILWHIATNRIISRSQIYVIPISDNVINATHHQAQKENMPKSLKITTKYKPWHSI